MYKTEGGGGIGEDILRKWQGTFVRVVFAFDKQQSDTRTHDKELFCVLFWYTDLFFKDLQKVCNAFALFV